MLGALLAELLFFLNPQIPLRTATVVRAIAAYGALGAAAGGLLIGLLFRRRKRIERILPWALTMALVLAALLSWWIPARLAFYLPPGINGRLLKAAVWLTVASVVGFLTALLHSMEARRYGKRSQAAFVLLAVVSVFVMIERRGSFSPRSEILPRAPAEMTSRARLLVVAVETATLDAVLPLAEQGALPFFSRLLEGGSYGRLTSLDPSPGEALWSTVATGMPPYAHGVVTSRVYPVPLLGSGVVLHLLPAVEPFREWAKLGGRGVPIDARVRRALTSWEILGAHGSPVAALGWPLALPPAIPLARAVIEPPDATGAVGDSGRREQLRSAQSKLGELSAAFVLLSGLRPTSRCCFGGYSAAEFDGVRAAVYVDAAERVREAYRRIDAELAALWEDTQPTVLAVVSAQGAASPEGWQRIRAGFSEERALKGVFSPSPDGFVILYGEGIRADGRLTGGRLVDVAPSLFYALGMPVARDLDGRVLRDAFSEEYLVEHPLTFVGSYESLRNR